MVRLLKTALANQDDDFDSVLTEEILAVDKQLLQVERATNEVSGKKYPRFHFMSNCSCSHSSILARTSLYVHTR